MSNLLPANLNQYVIPTGAQLNTTNTTINALIQYFNFVPSNEDITPLTINSKQGLIITGTLNETITLPDATTLPVGYSFIIINNSTGNVVIQNFILGNLLTLIPNQIVFVVCNNITTPAGTWINAPLQGVPKFYLLAPLSNLNIGANLYNEIRISGTAGVLTTTEIQLPDVITNNLTVGYQITITEDAGYPVSIKDSTGTLISSQIPVGYEILTLTLNDVSQPQGNWSGNPVPTDKIISSTSLPNTVMRRDVNNNSGVNNMFTGHGFISSTGGVTRLTNSSPQSLTCTGEPVQVVTLPDATTLPVGAVYFISYIGLDSIIINDGSNQLVQLYTNGYARCCLKDNSTSNGEWDIFTYNNISNVAYVTGQGEDDSAQVGSQSLTFATVQKAWDATKGIICSTVYLYPKDLVGYGDLLIDESRSNNLIGIGDSNVAGNLTINDNNNNPVATLAIFNIYWNNLIINNYNDNIYGGYFVNGAFNDITYTNEESSNVGIQTGNNYENMNITGNIDYFSNGYAKQTINITETYQTVVFSGSTRTMTINGTNVNVLFLNCSNYPKIVFANGATSAQISFGGNNNNIQTGGSTTYVAEIGDYQTQISFSEINNVLTLNTDDFFVGWYCYVKVLAGGNLVINNGSTLLAHVTENQYVLLTKTDDAAYPWQISHLDNDNISLVTLNTTNQSYTLGFGDAVTQNFYVTATGAILYTTISGATPTTGQQFRIINSFESTNSLQIKRDPTNNFGIITLAPNSEVTLMWNVSLWVAPTSMETSSTGTFTPDLISWTNSGTPTVTGLYTQVGHLIYMIIKVVPASGGSVSAILNTSSITGIPFNTDFGIFSQMHDQVSQGNCSYTSQINPQTTGTITSGALVFSGTFYATNIYD